MVATIHCCVLLLDRKDEDHTWYVKLPCFLFSAPCLFETHDTNYYDTDYLNILKVFINSLPTQTSLSTTDKVEVQPREPTISTMLVLRLHVVTGIHMLQDIDTMLCRCS